MVVRICQKAYVEARQSVQWVSAGHWGRSFGAHRNAVTTAVKRISRTSERSGKEKEEILKEDLERNVTLCLHNSFCRNRESNVDPLPCCKQSVEEKKCWRTASNSVRIANKMCCKTQRLKVQSQCRRKRRWSIDKWPENKMRKERKIEEFRSFRNSRR